MISFFRPREYYRPKNLAEASSILAASSERGRVIAGGTDLLLQKSKGVECIVDISKLGLDYIKENEQGICLGAATTVSAVHASPLFSSGPYLVLSEAAGSLATATIRNKATVGGNLCNASPAADLPLPLFVLEATLLAVGPEGERRIPVHEFFKDVNVTGLSKGELLKEICIPPCPENAGTCFMKLRRHMTAIDIAVVNAAVLLVCRSGICETARIAMGAVAPTPVRARNAEMLLMGRKLNEHTIQEAAEAAAAESKPIDDLRASAAYRKSMVAVLVSRALETSLRRCP